MDQSTQGSFQKIFMIGGFVFGVLGIFVFSISQFNSSAGDPNLTGTVTVWGTLPASKISEQLFDYSQDAKTYSVRYVEIPSDKFTNRFIEAIANEQGPDLLLVPENISVPLREYLAKFPEGLITEKQFKEKYIRSTYKLYQPNGVFAFPVAIDPLVMFVNTDILTNAGFSKAPTTWADVPLYVSRVLGFTKSDENSVQRAVALGALNNILYNREILLTMLMQLRNDVITWTINGELKRDPITQEETIEYEEKFESVLGLSSEDLKVKNDVLAEQVFVFFTSFVNPNIKEAYTWSKRAPLDRDLFSSGNLGLYFGLASDRDYLNSKNPHLKYEIALMPGPKGATANFRNTNYAKIYSVSISGRTRNLVLAQKVMEDILAKEFSNKIVSDYGLAPARQDELYTFIENAQTKEVEAVVEQKRVDQDIIYKAAERGDIVMEPLPNLIKNIFEQIVEAFSGSRQTPSEIIRNADQELIRIIQ